MKGKLLSIPTAILVAAGLLSCQKPEKPEDEEEEEEYQRYHGFNFGMSGF